MSQDRAGIVSHARPGALVLLDSLSSGCCTKTVLYIRLRRLAAGIWPAAIVLLWAGLRWYRPLPGSATLAANSPLITAPSGRTPAVWQRDGSSVCLKPQMIIRCLGRRV